MDFEADVAVIGLGAMGSNAAWQLASRGLSVVGIERFQPGHVHGSSHGQTRVFRVACLEHPDLVVLARRSCELFEELQKSSGLNIVRQSGAVMIGPPDSAVISGTLAAAKAHDLPIEQLDRSELLRRYPQHSTLAHEHVAIWDPEAGIAYPENAVIAAVDAARKAGAVIYTDTRVADIDLIEGGACITTATRKFVVRQVVVTTGAWLNKLVPALPLKPLRTPMMWFETRDTCKESYNLEAFPTFIRAVDSNNWIWGHGSGDGFGIKIGPDKDPNFYEVDPDTIDRYISAKDWALISDLVGRTFPELNPVPVRTTTCMVTDSPDGHFQIGRPHGDSRLIVGGGCSGHAFKHAAGIGELIAQIACNEPTLISTDFIDPNRFLLPPES